jgi:serine phosphatase RsbU (regulator of sigma subunit)
MKSFSNYVHPITKDTIIYIYSDGLIDQFGGPEGKKFQQTRLLDIILKTSNLPVETQGIVIEQAFDNWKDKMYQVDDVLFLGLKV